MPATPSPKNYTIGKANVYFTPEGGTRRHLGNIPTASFQIEVEKLEHFSSMTGIKTKDFIAVTSKSGTLTLTLEEMNTENLALALMGGAITDSTEGDPGFDIGVADAITGRVEIIGSNDVGPKHTWDFPAVTFTPNSAVDFISEDVMNVELTGDVNAIAGSFGRQSAQSSTE